MLKYIKKAFVNQWNLLIFAGGMGFAVLSGRPDIAVPLVLAGEAAYLGLLGTHPKFQGYVKAQEAKEGRQASSQQNMQVLEKIKASLPRKQYDRYSSLRERCLRLGQISDDLKTPTQIDPNERLESLQTKGLDRLLWVYLRLLFSQHSLDRFFDTVSEKRITDDLERIEFQLEELGPDDASAHSAKIRRTLLDNKMTLQERLDNYTQAQGNYQFVSLELERVENKIKSLAEISVNRQDPEYISGQIDAVANSMKETERTMNDLQFVTGLGDLDEEAPELMNSPERFVIDGN
ncbi:MAG: hypothetical protein AB8B55_01645 [Mariniblastus sp.]